MKGRGNEGYFAKRQRFSDNTVPFPRDTMPNWQHRGGHQRGGRIEQYQRFSGGRGGNRGGRGWNGGQNNNRSDFKPRSYLKPSMFEDPWSELCITMIGTGRLNESEADVNYSAFKIEGARIDDNIMEVESSPQHHQGGNDSASFIPSDFDQVRENENKISILAATFQFNSPAHGDTISSTPPTTACESNIATSTTLPSLPVPIQRSRPLMSLPPPIADSNIII